MKKKRFIEKNNFGPGRTPLYYKNEGLFSDSFFEQSFEDVHGKSDLSGKSSSGTPDSFLNQFWNINGASESNDLNKAFQTILNLWEDLDREIGKCCRSEADLENKWIRPIFESLNWKYTVGPRIIKNGISNCPDYALYKNSEIQKKDARKKNVENAIAIADAKKWGLNLDGDNRSNQNPSFQIVNYLRQTGKEWGIITNGMYWRIYSTRSERRHVAYYEINLEKILSTEDPERFRYFYNFFRPEAFSPSAQINDKCFLDFVYEEGRDETIKIEENLHKRVLEVVESVCQGFFESGQGNVPLKDVYENSIYYIFKLMFVLNCESKGLLEVDKQDDYYENSLRKKCLDIKRQCEEGKSWSKEPLTYNYINGLFKILKDGDANIGVYGFGEGPFDVGCDSFYSQRRSSDEILNKAIFDLSCIEDKDGRQQLVDYKMISPDHMGSLFEGLLEMKLEKDKNGLNLLNDKGERKSSGSYYTPEYMVDYIVKETLENQVKDKSFKEILELKILDNAMGSGHFFLGAVRYLENCILEIQ
ncbi:MAG: hypothetical protein OXB84_05540, partial [Halobacteriovoraceae bacterium]|nr:hypothetical protein [Halobacteriovoraceae bacterium]